MSAPRKVHLRQIKINLPRFCFLLIKFLLESALTKEIIHINTY